MKPPREWRLRNKHFKTGERHYDVFLGADGECLAHNESVYVIEKSAYDTLLAENKELKATSIAAYGLIDQVEGLQEENKALREKLGIAVDELRVAVDTVDKYLCPNALAKINAALNSIGGE